MRLGWEAAGTLTLGVSSSTLEYDSSPSVPGGVQLVAGRSTVRAQTDSAGGAGLVTITLVTAGMCGVHPAGARGESGTLTTRRHDGDGLHRPEDGAAPSILAWDPQEEPALHSTESFLISAEDAPGGW